MAIWVYRYICGHKYSARPMPRRGDFMVASAKGVEKMLGQARKLDPDTFFTYKTVESLIWLKKLMPEGF